MTRILLWTGGIPQNVPVKTRQRFSMKTVLSDQAVFRFLPSIYLWDNALTANMIIR